MNIFHLDDGKELRGGQRQMLYLVKELNRLGHNNYIVCRKNSVLEQTAIKKKLKTINLAYNFEWNPLTAIQLRGIIKKISKNETPVLHAHTAHTAALAYLAGLLLPCIKIVHRRVDFVPAGGLSFTLKYLRAHRVIAISSAIKTIMFALGLPENKVALINSTLDPDETPWDANGFDNYKKTARAGISEKFNIPVPAPLLGSLIALVPHKDPHNLIRSAALVLQKHPEAHFIIAGIGELKKSSEALIQQLNISDNVHLIGYYPDSHELLAALDIFILPSEQEGMGSVLIEAMNAGLAIVATNAGGIPDVIENRANGLLVEKNDHAALAKAQLELLENAPLKRRLEHSAMLRRLDFASPKMATQTLAVYEEELKNFKLN